MNDIELTRALERCDVPNQSFRHASHLHVAWVYLSESDSVDEAAHKMAKTLRQFSASIGHPEKYHETLTGFWMRLLAVLRASMPDCDLNYLVVKHPRLLEKDLPLEYYSPGRIFSDQARSSRIDPDLKPLPTNATALRSSRPTGHTSDCSVPQQTA